MFFDSGTPGIKSKKILLGWVFESNKIRKIEPYYWIVYVELLEI